MNEHVHVWEPVPLRIARYSCACGAFGRRSYGKIVPYANGKLPPDPLHVEPYHPSQRHVSEQPSEPEVVLYDGPQPKGTAR